METTNLYFAFIVRTTGINPTVLSQNAICITERCINTRFKNIKIVMGFGIEDKASMFDGHLSQR